MGNRRQSRERFLLYKRSDGMRDYADSVLLLEAGDSAGCTSLRRTRRDDGESGI